VIDAVQPMRLRGPLLLLGHRWAGVAARMVAAGLDARPPKWAPRRRRG